MSSSFGDVQTPATLGSGNQETSQEVAERKKGEQVHEYADAKLKSLVKSDDMYYALEYFLLGDPERQIEQLGDVSAIIAKGDEAKSKNENVYAMTYYETAAKVAIYKGDKEAARRCLIKAQEVIEDNEKGYRLMTTLIDDMDEAIGIARSYYEVVTKELLPIGET